MDQKCLDQSFQTVKSSILRNGQSDIIFETCFEGDALLKCHQIQEVFFSFYNFSKTFESLKEEEKPDFIDNNDYILCSLLSRILKTGNILLFVIPSIRKRLGTDQTQIY
jgi:hypothetical protein